MFSIHTKTRPRFLFLSRELTYALGALVLRAKYYAKLYIKDIIYGANDGIISTFAVVASIEGAQLSSFAILIVGFASLCADGASMATSSYLAYKSDKEVRSLDNYDESGAKPFLEALVTFFSFITAGSVPLIPYILLGHENPKIYMISALSAITTLFLIGGLRTRITQKNFIVAGLEMGLLGSLAGAIAYTVGLFVASLR